MPPGTNGGVSTRGLLASAAGGLVMGLTVALDLCIEDPGAVAARATRAGYGAGHEGLVAALETTAWWAAFKTGGVVAFGVVAGLAGSLVS